MTDALHSLRKNTAGRIGQSIAGKLYCFALLSIVAVISLAACSIYFAKTTETAAHRLYDYGFRGTLGASRLGLLLEQHRRIVESMLSEVDRARERSMCWVKFSDAPSPIHCGGFLPINGKYALDIGYCHGA